MIIGKKDKDLIETLKNDRLKAIKYADKLQLELANVYRDYEKERAEFIGEIVELKKMLKACTDSITEFNKCLSNSVVTTNEVVSAPSMPDIPTEETIPKTFFLRIREIISATNWDQVARTLGLSATQLNKYRKGILPLTREKIDEFTYLATKAAKKGTK